jgi:hypothetical protein
MIKPEEGEVIVVASSVPVKVTLGGRNPLLVEFTSSMAPVAGVV